jgi:D5 N terminal like
MTKDANDIHRELGTDAARALADSLPDILFETEEAPKAARGNGHDAAADGGIKQEAKTFEQWTELGNAHRLVRHHGEDIRYVHPLEAWFIWDGVFWRRDDTGDIMRRAEATVEAIFDEAKEISDEEIRTAYRKFALKSQSRAQLSATVQLAQHIT